MADWNAINTQVPYQLQGGSGGGGGGTVTGAANVGGGAGELFEVLSGTTLNFRTLTSTDGSVGITTNATTVDLVATASLQTAYDNGPGIAATDTLGPVDISGDAGDPPSVALLALDAANATAGSDALVVTKETAAIATDGVAIRLDHPNANVISAHDAAVADTAGGALFVKGGYGNGTGNGGTMAAQGGSGDPAGTGVGGPISLSGGIGSPTGDGGFALLAGGLGGSTAGAGGEASVVGGNAAADGAGGAVNVTGGDGAGAAGDGGHIVMLGGTGAGTGTNGFIEMSAVAPEDQVLQITGDANPAFVPGVVHLVTTQAPWLFRFTASANGAGNQGTTIQVLGGFGETTSDGGAINLIGGYADQDPAGSGDGGTALLGGGNGPGGTGDGGPAGIFGGLGGLTAGNGGEASISGGNASAGDSLGGNVTVVGGAGSGAGGGGAIDMLGGNGGDTGDGGTVVVGGGAGGATSGNGGSAFLTGGTAATSGDGGNVGIDAGDAAGTGGGGSISFTPGSPAGGGDNGFVNVEGSGFQPAQLDDAAEAALAGQRDGSLIWNTTDSEHHYWNGAAWVPFGGGGGSVSLTLDADATDPVFETVDLGAGAVTNPTPEVAGTHSVLEFVQAADRAIPWQRTMPVAYDDAADLTLSLYWTQPGTGTDDVVWAAAIENLGAGENILTDGFATLQTAAAAAAPGVAGQVVRTDITFDNAAADVLAAGAPFRVAIQRSGSAGGDDLAEDVLLVRAVLTQG